MAMVNARSSWLRPVVMVALAAAVPAVLPAGAAGARPPVAATAPAGPCDDIDPAALAELPVVDVLEEVDSLATFGAAVTASGVDLARGGPFTVFAATNDAIEAIPQNVFDTLVADQALLAALISHHVVAGWALTGDDLVELGSVATLNGPVAVVADGATMSVDGADVVCPAIAAADAVIYVIDRVLQPPPAAPGACPGSSVPGSSVPDSSAPGSSVPGSSVPC